MSTTAIHVQKSAPAAPTRGRSTTSLRPPSPEQHRATLPWSLQRKATVSSPGDSFETEADAIADKVMNMALPGPIGAAPVAVQRKCKKCEDEDEPPVQTKPSSSRQEDAALDPGLAVHAAKQGGKPLPESLRAYFEPRFGYDFSRVRIHADGASADAARAVQARAYTVGSDIVFGSGAFAPSTGQGMHLLAHELVHVVQQSGAAMHQAPSIQRSAMATESPVADPPVEESHAAGSGGTAPPPAAHAGPSPIPRPETCPPPADLSCAPGTTSPGAVTHRFGFPQDQALLTPMQRAEIDAAAAAWHSAGAGVTVRIDGYASAEGACDYNWYLSCRRAMAVANELEHPGDGSTGVPSANVETFAHGETDEWDHALAPNRLTTISMPVPPPPPAPTCPPCTYPLLLGTGRTGCGHGSDFTHFDFPHISFASEAKLAAWATLQNLPSIIPNPDRTLVPNVQCELEMAGVLSTLAGGAGLAAYHRFAAGTGGTETLGPGTTLGSLALVSPEFTRTVAAVRRDIESKLAAQAASGCLAPCAFSPVIPPATHFGMAGRFSPGPLKTVIGGTHGEKLFCNGFTGNLAARTYTIDLRFLICDNFGVDEADLYAPGLFGFWVLQHERSPTLYAPFINELDLPVTLSGTF
ncbi:eCIS core domain-containing protein [Dyella subtropica]|uniref:eCIS core domain-containing protein n=1 Tax=Dyella subtropica TaxID=2992127 RepID=UPI002259DCBF|nr:DUF4157 domain-containing protein [Dyella subtropica]